MNNGFCANCNKVIVGGLNGLLEHVIEHTSSGIVRFVFIRRIKKSLILIVENELVKEQTP